MAIIKSGALLNPIKAKERLLIVSFSPIHNKVIPNIRIATAKYPTFTGGKFFNVTPPINRPAA